MGNVRKGFAWWSSDEVVFITDATARELVDYCAENDIDLDSVRIGYGPCGSHEVILEEVQQ